MTKFIFPRDRFNFTNVDDPYFALDMLELINSKLIEENDSALIAVYAVNQKGRSAAVVIRDLELGTTVKLDRGNEAKLNPPAIICMFIFYSKLNCHKFTRFHPVLHRNRANYSCRVRIYCI